MQKKIVEQFNCIEKKGKKISSDRKKLQAIDRVLYCDSINFQEILNIISSTGKKQTQKVFIRMLFLINLNRLSSLDQKLIKRAINVYKHAQTSFFKLSFCILTRIIDVRIINKKFEFLDQPINKDKTKFDNIKSIVSINRLELLERIYKEIEDLLVDLFKNFDDTSIQAKLNNKNKKIATKNKINNIKTSEYNNVLIDIKTISKFFVRQNVLYKELA